MGSSPNDDIPITDEDLAAADELWANENFPSEEKRDAFRRFSAYLHARWGDHKFRVRHRLKPPSNRYEELDAALYQGRINHEQFREQATEYLTRPADMEMLEKLISELEKLLDSYGRFMRAIVDLVHDQPKASIGRANHHARALKAKVGVFKDEMMTACQFLTEARVRQGRTVVTAGGYTAPTVVELICIILDSTAKLWASCRRIARESQTGTRYGRFQATTAYQLFWDTHFKGLAQPYQLLALLQEERAVGRLALAADAKDATRSVDSMQLNLNANNIHVNVASRGLNAGKDARDAKAPLLTVDTWDDLALGIDEKRRVWAITPPPVDGTIFQKSKAVRIPIRKGDPFTLLTTLASSQTGRSVDITIAAAALGLQPPPASLPDGNRAEPNALRGGQTEGLTSKGSTCRTKLNEILSGIGSRLREVVAGPVGKGNSALSIEQKIVTSGFVVRYLYQDENRHVRFGIKPS